MDAVFRLRVLIWLLVLGLWGVMVYQYLGEEELDGQRMQYVQNPYRGVRPPGAPARRAPEPARAEPALDEPAAHEEAEARLVASAETRPSSLDYIKALPPRSGALPPRTRRYPPLRRERRLPRADPPIPPGFVKTATPHFNIYAEGAPASERFSQLLESLHTNLMLDLDSFSPWVADHRVSIFLFQNQETYRQVTGRPAWSGGASSVPKRRVYVYESEELPGILAHELCHIYYDGFFLDGRPNPLWLSEGMATLVQVERGLAAPNWLRENLELLERGGGYPIDELLTVTTTSGASDDKVRLWYAQSYSVVRFLVRSQYKSSFYRFSSYLRDGKDVTQSLYRAYGMPFNRVKALEYAWRYELGNEQMMRLSPREK